MFNWLKGAALRKFAGMQRRELVQFIDMLEGLDESDLGLVVALAADFKNKVADRFDLSDPEMCPAEVPLQLVRYYRELQKEKMQVLAPGVAVWVHTTRAVHAPENRAHVRRMWGLLAKGIAYVEDAAEGFEATVGIALNVDGYGFPVGFEPKVENIEAEFEWIARVLTDFANKPSADTIKSVKERLAPDKYNQNKDEFVWTEIYRDECWLQLMHRDNYWSAHGGGRYDGLIFNLIDGRIAMSVSEPRFRPTGRSVNAAKRSLLRRPEFYDLDALMAEWRRK